MIGWLQLTELLVMEGGTAQYTVSIKSQATGGNVSFPWKLQESNETYRNDQTNTAFVQLMSTNCTSWHDSFWANIDALCVIHFHNRDIAETTTYVISMLRKFCYHLVVRRAKIVIRISCNFHFIMRRLYNGRRSIWYHMHADLMFKMIGFVAVQISCVT